MEKKLAFIKEELKKFLEEVEVGLEEIEKHLIKFGENFIESFVAIKDELEMMEVSDFKKEFLPILEAMTKTFPKFSNLLADIKMLQKIIEKTKEDIAL